MANDDETLTFRLRAVAENMAAFGKAARGAEDVNAAMIKSQKTAEALAVSNRKLTAARDKEADAAGRVRVAETRLKDIRDNTKSKVTQIAAAEERLATARRNSSRATNDANRIEADFKKVAEGALSKIAGDSGEKAGNNFQRGFRKVFRGGGGGGGIVQDVEKSSSLVGRTFGTGILSGLEGILKSEAGPAFLAAMIAALAVVAPAIGAVLAGGIVTAFGAGLVTLGIIFAAKSDAVKAKWKATATAMGQDLRGISAPFEGVLIHMADSVRATFGRFAPILRSVFAGSAGPVQRFADDVLKALERFKPALAPISRAFNQLLASLGPALQASLGSIADGLIAISNSVSKNPTGFPDLIRNVGDLTNMLLKAFGILNDANGAFERLTGGTSAVTFTMGSLKIMIATLLSPLLLLAKYVSVASSVISALTHSSEASGKSMSDAANKTVQLAQGLQATKAGATGLKKPLMDTHDIAVSNAKAADLAAKKYEDWLTQMFAMQNLALTLAHAQLGLAQAISAATQSIKDNGKTLNLHTKAGQANYAALLDVADAANKQTDSMIRNKQSVVSAAQAAEKSKANFIRLAVQMGLNKAAAKRMADQMIAIPNVSRRAVLTAVKTDLDRKLADARRQLKDPNLTKERKAKLNADIALLTKKLQQAQAQINALHGKTVTVNYTSSGVLAVKIASSTRGGGKVGGPGAATGGKIRGPGTGISDEAGHFALSNREWVIKAKSSQKYGDYAMGSVNDGTATIIPGMAAGGRANINVHSKLPFANAKAFQAAMMNTFMNIGAGGPSGSAGGAGRWRGVALSALAAAGAPASWIGSLLHRMNQESGGNPRAINLWDSNAKRGTPSIGLMQTIGPTFSAYAGPYRGRGIYDPFANIYAAIKYTIARYGSGPAGWNRAGGYKNGGWLMPGQLAYNETRRPEAVFNGKQLSEMGSGGSDKPIVVQLMLDGKVLQQSLVHLNRDKGYKGLGFGPGERT